LIVAIQRESKQLQALEQENRDLRITLNDYANALELIMSKYRQQVSQLIQSNHHNNYPHHHRHHNHHHSNHQKTDNSNKQPVVSSKSQHKQADESNRKSGGKGGNIVSQESPAVKRLQVYDSPNTSSSSSSSVPHSPHTYCYQRHPDLMMMNRHRDKIMEMAAVMMKAVELDEKDSSKDQEVLMQLRTENQGLRQLLAISRQNGSQAQRMTNSSKAVAAANAGNNEVEEDDDDNSQGSVDGKATMIPKRKITTRSVAIQTSAVD
jgi:hypothetical protein